jgi:hypothetical protein
MIETPPILGSLSLKEPLIIGQVVMPELYIQQRQSHQPWAVATLQISTEVPKARMFTQHRHRVLQAIVTVQHIYGKRGGKDGQDFCEISL